MTTDLAEHSTKEKKYRCPVHGGYDARRWGPHRRWCRAGAGKKRKAVEKRKVSAKSKARKASPPKYERNGFVLLNARQAALVLKNGERETLIAQIIYADAKDAVRRIREAIEKALG
jgi:hypothetical protein